MQNRPQESLRSRNIFACFTAAATLILIFAGGLVTSTGSGLSVPDWPLSYGLLFPPMVGGIFYEHGHRMIAGTVAILTTVLAIWTWRSEPRGWVRGLAAAALGAVVLQAVLGGITVLFLLPPAVSVSHACLAQAFLCLVVTLATVTSEGWVSTQPRETQEPRSSLVGLAATTTGIVYMQLILGAVMRHIGAGLAIPDFPLSFGRLVPELTSAAVVIHFAHRLGAVAVFASALWTVRRVLTVHRHETALVRPAVLLIALVTAQVMLGAFIVWTRKAAVPTTAHVATGAAVLATSLVLALRAYRLHSVSVPASTPAFVSPSGNPRHDPTALVDERIPA